MASAGTGHDLGWARRGVAVASPLVPRRLPSPAGRAATTRLARVSPAGTPDAPATVLVYSSRAETREAVRTAVGRRPAPDVGPLTWVECATGDEVVAAVDGGGIALCILDGEAQPTGGLALARQLDQEVPDRPAVCVLIARQPDRWLAHWSRAEGTLPLPVDPLTAPGLVADLLRSSARRPAVR
jgi:CheY-like chemotaxis protein